MSYEGDRVYASFLWRVAACLIDFVVVMAVVVVIAIGAGLGIEAIDAFLHFDKQLLDSAATVTGGAIGLVVWVVYFAGMESSKWQATPGKLLTGLSVSDMKGNRISFGRAMLRSIFKVMSGFLFGFAYLVCLFTEHKQTLHDILANTLVWKANRNERK